MPLSSVELKLGKKYIIVGAANKENLGLEATWDGEYIRWNRKGTKMFGSPKKMTSMRFEEVVQYHNTAEYSAALRKLLG